MAVSRGTISPSEKSNGKDVGIGSRTHVLGDICFMKFKPISLVTLLNPRKSTRELTLPKTVRRGMKYLAVNGITCPANLVDKKKFDPCLFAHQLRSDHQLVGLL